MASEIVAIAGQSARPALDRSHRIRDGSAPRLFFVVVVVDDSFFLIGFFLIRAKRLFIAIMKVPCKGSGIKTHGRAQSERQVIKCRCGFDLEVE